MPFKNPHPLYAVWRSMRDRCLNKNFKQWNDYGGRGITICPEWDSFATFVADMGERPEGHSLDRINTDWNYEPSNCRWAAPSVQQRNRRCTRIVYVEGKSYTAIELAELAGVKTDTIVQRAKQGLSYEEIINPKRRVFTDGLKLGGRANGCRKKTLTHCPQGHEYTPENTTASPQGWRRCRECHRTRERARRAAI